MSCTWLVLKFLSVRKSVGCYDFLNHNNKKTCCFLSLVENKPLLLLWSINPFRSHHLFPSAIYLFKVNNGNTRTMCEICSKLILLRSMLFSLQPQSFHSTAVHIKGNISTQWVQSNFVQMLTFLIRKLEMSLWVVFFNKSYPLKYYCTKCKFEGLFFF